VRDREEGGLFLRFLIDFYSLKQGALVKKIPLCQLLCKTNNLVKLCVKFLFNMKSGILLLILKPYQIIISYFKIIFMSEAEKQYNAWRGAQVIMSQHFFFVFW
jgi:hypothetical protein